MAEFPLASLQPTIVMRLALALIALPTLAPSSLAGDWIVEASGTVITASPSATSPFTTVTAGWPVRVHFEVEVPGSAVAPGQYVEYDIDGATSYIAFGQLRDGLTGGTLAIQNDFPVADGIRVLGAPAAGGGSVVFEAAEPTGTLFSTTDITQIDGSWPASTWSSFQFSLAGDGSTFEFSLPHVAIFATTIGTNYCVANANSTGVSASIGGTGSADVAANDLGLCARYLPQNSFGMFITSRTPGFNPNPVGSPGFLCIQGQVGRFLDVIPNSGTTREIAIAVDLTRIPQPTGSVAGVVGETWYFQAWYRDANPTPSSNFTDGLEVLLR